MALDFSAEHRGEERELARDLASARTARAGIPPRWVPSAASERHGKPTGSPPCHPARGPRRGPGHRIGGTGDDHRAWPVDRCDRAPGLVGDRVARPARRRGRPRSSPHRGATKPISRPLAATSLAASSTGQHAGQAGGGELADAVADAEGGPNLRSAATSFPARRTPRTTPAARGWCDRGRDRRRRSPRAGPMAGAGRGRPPRRRDVPGRRDWRRRAAASCPGTASPAPSTGARLRPGPCAAGADDTRSARAPAMILPQPIEQGAAVAVQHEAMPLRSLHDVGGAAPGGHLWSSRSSSAVTIDSALRRSACSEGAEMREDAGRTGSGVPTAAPTPAPRARCCRRARTNSPRPASRSPAALRAVGQAQPVLVQPQSRIGAVAEHRRRQHAVVQRQARLDERRDPRAALGVADVPLDRTEQARLAAARLVDIQYSSGYFVRSGKK